MSGMFNGSGSGSGNGTDDGVEFNCLVDDTISSSRISNMSHWTIRSNLHYSTPYVATVTIIFFLLSFFWNLFIIVTFFIKRHLLKEAGNVFLLNLAVTDFLISILVILFSIVTEIAQEFVFGDTDVLRCDICHTAGVFLMFLVQLSVHTLAALSIDRFIHLWKPLHYDHIMTIRRVVVVLIILWVISLVIAILPLVGFGQIEFNRNFGACLFRFTGENADSGISNFYYALFVVVWDLMPILVLMMTNVFTYKFISKFLKRNFKRRSTYRKREDVANKQEGSHYHKQQRQLVKVFSALFVANIVSWTPVIVVVFLIIGIDADTLPDEIYTFGWICYLTNPVLHPILESLFVKELRYQVNRAQKSVKRAGSAIYRSSTSFFRNRDLEEANKALDKFPDRPSTRRIHFFSEQTTVSTSLRSSPLGHDGDVTSPKPRPQRRITFSDEVHVPGLEDLRTTQKAAMPAVVEEGDETQMAITQTTVPNGQSILSNGKYKGQAMHAQIDLCEDSSVSAAEPETVHVESTLV